MSETESDTLSPEERVERVQERVHAACERAGRAPDSVGLVAVSKKFPAEKVIEVASCGLSVFGENRVQEAIHKIPECPPQLKWHLIGHLQSNKSKPAAQLFDCVHSVDSIKLLDHLDRAAAECGKTLEVFLQVNVSGEASKTGAAPGELAGMLEHAGGLMNLDVNGLMTMPPVVKDPADARPHFAALRELRDRLREETGFPLDELSMGMSHDFEQAILEGATWIRIGTDLFGKRTT